MNLESFKYFVTAAEELNFTKAAKKLYVTQQALSKQIDKIEKFYNTRLFNREPPMSLTPEGECLYQYMCRILDDERQMRKELDSLLDISSHTLIIGVSYYRSSLLLPRMIAEYTKLHPQIRIEVKEDCLAKTMEALKLGKVDLMFGYSQPEDPALVSRDILEESVMLGVPKKLAEEYISQDQLRRMQQMEEVSLKVFAECPFIRMSDYTWLGSLFDQYCEEEGISPRIVLDSGSVFTTLDCCAEGIGAALIPRLYLKSLTDQQLKGLYLFRWDYPASRCRSAILYLKRSYMTNAAKDFIKIAQSSCAAMDAELDAWFNQEKSFLHKN